MASAKPGLLLFTSNMDRMCEPVAERFDVLRLWSEGDAAIRERGAGVVAILTAGKDRIDATLMQRLPKLRLIVAVGAGYEGVDVRAARMREIIVANAGDTHSGDVADHAVALALSVIQRIPAGDAWVRSGTWETKGYPPNRRALSAERFGILGLGRIGSAIASRLAPFGAEMAGGFAPYFPPLKDADNAFSVLTALAYGLRGFNLYMAVERDRWIGAPIDPHGRPRPMAPSERAFR